MQTEPTRSFITSCSCSRQRKTLRTLPALRIRRPEARVVLSFAIGKSNRLFSGRGRSLPVSPPGGGRSADQAAAGFRRGGEMEVCQRSSRRSPRSEVIPRIQAAVMDRRKHRADREVADRSDARVMSTSRLLSAGLPARRRGCALRREGEWTRRKPVGTEALPSVEGDFRDARALVF